MRCVAKPPHKLIIQNGTFILKYTLHPAKTPTLCLVGITWWWRLL